MGVGVGKQIRRESIQGENSCHYYGKEEGEGEKGTEGKIHGTSNPSP
jgi:hypothetical protein